MNCAEFESILADYVDETLPASERAAVELHAAGCVACRAFMAEVTGAVGVLSRLQEVEPPAELITRIAYATPRGRSLDEWDVPGFWAKLKAKWLEPLLQPRLAMGMAMTVLSFSMLARCTGVPVQHLQPADLSPAHIIGNIEDRIVRSRDRFVKNYENLKIVYEIEARLQEVDRQAPASAPTSDQSNQQDQKGKKK